MAGRIQRDRISELPESVVHTILCFLPLKDAARTSTLSNRWKSIWLHLQYLDFGPEFFRYDGGTPTDQVNKRMQLLEVANRIILSRPYGLSIERFRLAFPVDTEGDLILREEGVALLLGGMLDEWMACLLSDRLELLELQLDSDSGWWVLPSAVLSAKSITCMSLGGVSLLSLSFLDVKFLHLQKLFLSCVSMEDDIMQKLITGCPSLERLSLISCPGLTSVYVARLVKLKVLYVWTNQDLEILFNLDMATCPCLRMLNLQDSFRVVGLGTFFDSISQFLALEHLFISGIAELKKFKFSCPTLKTLHLRVLPKLRKAEINAPSLEKFRFENVEIVPTIELNAPPTVEIILVFLEDFEGVVDDEWYDDLTEFLESFEDYSLIKLCGGFNDAHILIPQGTRKYPIFSTDNLGLLVDRSKFVSAELEKLVEYMLWLSPHAVTLSIETKDDVLRRATRPGVQKRIRRVASYHKCKKNECEDPSSSGCKFLAVECWRHQLAEVSFNDRDATLELFLEFV